MQKAIKRDFDENFIKSDITNEDLPYSEGSVSKWEPSTDQSVVIFVPPSKKTNYEIIDVDVIERNVDQNITVDLLEKTNLN